MRGRVVIVEDDEVIREILRDFFSKKGLEVLEASEPLTCPVYVNDEPCACPEGTVCGDLLITDMNMPRMNGLQFIDAQIKHGCKGITRNKAIISGAFRDEDIQKMKEIGCTWFAKPFRLTDIEAWAQKCLEGIDPNRRLRDFSE